MVGKQLSELFPEETVTELKPKLQATINGSPQSFDIKYMDQIHHIETRPVDIDGEPYGVLVTQEVTDVRKITKELKQQNERLDQFASMVSHDLRNPLGVALGELEEYRETGDDAYLDGVKGALERIEDLIVDLTALAQTSHPSKSFKPVSLSTVAQDAWRMLDTRTASLETQDCTINGNRSQLQALFENLFRNAIGHGGENITVRVGPIEDGFYVEDTGEGIPQENREHVFEHGFTSGYSGNGIGLTIVSRIAADHDLDVSLSESPEGGARFEFS